MESLSKIVPLRTPLLRFLLVVVVVVGSEWGRRAWGIVEGDCCVAVVVVVDRGFEEPPRIDNIEGVREGEWVENDSHRRHPSVEYLERRTRTMIKDLRATNMLNGEISRQYRWGLEVCGGIMGNCFRNLVPCEFGVLL